MKRYTYCNKITLTVQNYGSRFVTMAQFKLDVDTFISQFDLLGVGGNGYSIVSCINILSIHRRHVSIFFNHINNKYSKYKLNFQQSTRIRKSIPFSVHQIQFAAMKMKRDELTENFKVFPLNHNISHYVIPILQHFQNRNKIVS